MPTDCNQHPLTNLRTQLVSDCLLMVARAGAGCSQPMTARIQAQTTLVRADHQGHLPLTAAGAVEEVVAAAAALAEGEHGKVVVARAHHHRGNPTLARELC